VDDAALVGAEIGEDDFFLKIYCSLGCVGGQIFESIFATFLVVVDIEMEFRPESKSLEEDKGKDHSEGGQTFSVTADKNTGVVERYGKKNIDIISFLTFNTDLVFGEIEEGKNVGEDFGNFGVVHLFC